MIRPSKDADPLPSSAHEPSGRAVWCGLTFLAVTVAVALFALRSEVLYDTDSYFHLAVGDLYATSGVVDELEWTRFSALRDGFGDKEVLFHLLLAPFTRVGDGAVGGRVALALLNGALAALLVGLGWRALGRWALCLPVFCWLGSQDFVDRVIRLRPELLALALFLLAAEAAARDRPRWLGLVAFLFALSYTAIHALLLLCVLWFSGRLLLRSETRFGLVLAPLVGAAAGLLAHPHFPHNLTIWKIQTLDYFRLKDTLDVGNEIQPARTDVLLGNNWGWVVALLVLLVSALGSRAENGDESGSGAANAALTYGIGAFAFAGLTLLMHRFSIYAVPFTLLAASCGLAAAGRRPTGRTLAFGRVPSLPTLALLLAALAAPAAGVVQQLWGMATASGGELAREDDWLRLGRSLPPGTRVAADWGVTQPLTYFAPHLEYLNVLDPVFMALPHPERHHALRALLEGQTPDPVAALVEELDSQVLVVSRFQTDPELLAQWLAHPQLEPVYSGYTIALRVIPPPKVHPGPWRASPPGTQPPVSEATGGAPFQPHPASGYLAPDASHGDCTLLSSDPLTEPRRYELAPWGPTELWVGDQRLLTAANSLRRLAGSGLDVEIPPDGPLTVWTCRDTATGRIGVSLRPL